MRRVRPVLPAPQSNRPGTSLAGPGRQVYRSDSGLSRL